MHYRDIPVTRRVAPEYAKRKDDEGCCHVQDRRELVCVIYVFNLLITACNQSCLVTFEDSVRVEL